MSLLTKKIMTGSTNTKRFKLFQIRWKEKLGHTNDPYLIRWTVIFFGYSIRLHHWIKSDDKRFFHDHSSDLLSIVLFGDYWNVKPEQINESPEKGTQRFHVEGIFNTWKNILHFNKSVWFSKAGEQHYLDIPRGGAWTILFEGRPYRKWGFWVNGSKWRPLRYFHKYGIIQNNGNQ